MKIKTSFNEGFSVKMPNGQVRRFGVCQWSTDDHWAIDGKELIHHSSRDEGFRELSRETLPPGTMATEGYHDDEHGKWKTV